MAHKGLSLKDRFNLIKSALFSKGELSWRGPFSGIGELGNSFLLSPVETGWQRNLGYGQQDVQRFGPVYACISILAQELSRIPIIHYRLSENNERVPVENKAPYRVFKNPNKYQSKSDFIMYLMWSLLTDGNAYAVVTRNDRYEVNAMYPVAPHSMWPYIVDGEIFYRFGDQVIRELTGFEEDVQWFPQRDILHIRMHCPRHPLIGESPITAAYVPAVTGIEINHHTASFFHNMGRPSGILRHPGDLDSEAMVRIKDRFKELFTKGNTGEPIVLREGMDWKPLTMSAVDAELVKSFALTERQVAQVFRVPPFLLGDLEKATFQNVESLARFFIQSSLGWYVDHFESSLGNFFELPNNEYIHFDVESALLRGDLKERMEAYAKGVQNGVLAPNDARYRENLPPAEYGDEPRVQQQLVPLSYGMMVQPPGMPPVGDQLQEEPEPTEEEAYAAEIIARRAIEKAMAS